MVRVRIGVRLTLTLALALSPNPNPNQPIMAAVNEATVRWRAPPLGADLTHACCALDALEACLFAGGATDAQAAYASALWRWSILQLALVELRGP